MKIGLPGLQKLQIKCKLLVEKKEELLLLSWSWMDEAEAKEDRITTNSNCKVISPRQIFPAYIWME